MKTYQRSASSGLVQKMCMHAPLAISVDLAHEIVYGALEYARKYGFEPHPDFTRLHADQVLDRPDTHPRSHNVQFGTDGKPVFAPVLTTTNARSSESCKPWNARQGKGISYMIGFGEAGFFDE